MKNHHLSKYDEDEDDNCYSAALPEEDDGYSSSSSDSSSKPDPDAMKFGSSGTPLTSTTASVSDMESFATLPPLSQEDDDDTDSVVAKISKRKKKGAKGSNEVSKKSTKSKKKSSKIDYSGLSPGALKLELKTCGVAIDGLTEKAEFVKALEDFKKAEIKKEKSKKKKTAKYVGSQSMGQIDFANGTVSQKKDEVKKKKTAKYVGSQSLGQIDFANGTVSEKKYAKDDEVLYVSSNGESESATILKVHLDDDLVPFYDIRLHSSGREKQTDDAHLAPLLAAEEREESEVPIKMSSSAEKPQRGSSIASVRSSKSSVVVVKPQKTYAANDKVLYVNSSNGESESATILKVHLDDQLVPFYDIRLHSSGREKQTDDAHLKPATRERKKTKGKTDKPQGHNSMGPLSNMSSLRTSTSKASSSTEYSFTPDQRASAKTASSSSEYSFTPDQRASTKMAAASSSEYSFTPDQLTKKSEAPQRHSSITFGNLLPDGFVSPHQQKKRATMPRKNKIVSASEQLKSTLPDGFVSPHRSQGGKKRTTTTTVAKRNKSLSANRRAASGSALPRLDRLDLASGSSSGVRSSGSKRSKALRRRSYDNSGVGAGAGDYKVVSPTARPAATSASKPVRVRKLGKATS
eukprot:CAMPEP_0113647198 /NCGR_PEP_ID=MMETSP0017_2-20120614/24975_1 /TAXON_ID=2856 /ORGANISM="Cylindrotheca closterium" /LENGTH=632 /DNA_ID=CAMNT_0000559223 /DNA_START=125 /DNA_END=2023 /DNA_ORIENTATION=+ /assembly_acc=CAM_ASM_000147